MKESQEKLTLKKIKNIKNFDLNEFILIFKRLTVSEMKAILLEGGFWTKSRMKSVEIQQMFLDVIDEKITPTDNDKIKIERSLERKNKVKIEVALDEVDSEIERLYNEFKESKFNEETVSSIIYICNLASIGKMSKEEVLRCKKEMKTVARKIYLRIHPDKKLKTHKKYAKRFGCYNAHFSQYENMYSERLERIREEEKREENSRLFKEEMETFEKSWREENKERPKNNMF